MTESTILLPHEGDGPVQHAQIPVSPCPVCGAANDCATATFAPDPGDLVVCWGCAAASQLDADLRPILLTPEQQLALPSTVLDRLNELRGEVLRRKVPSAMLTEFGALLAQMLAVEFGVDMARIEVRVSAPPLADRPGLHSVRIEIELDGETPPPEWGRRVEELFRMASALISDTLIAITTGEGSRAS